MTAEEQIVLDTAIRNGMPSRLAGLILAQAKHESANFTSGVYRDCNNAFGYSAYAGQGSCQGHSFYKAYSSLADSVKEITAWIKRRQAEGKFPANLNEIQTPEQYAALLKQSNYYEDSVTNYSNGLKNWFVANLLPVSTGLIGLILVVAMLILNNSNKYLK